MTQEMTMSLIPSLRGAPATKQSTPRVSTWRQVARNLWIATGLTALAMTQEMTMSLIPSLRGALATKQSTPRVSTCPPIAHDSWIATGLTALAMTKEMGHLCESIKWS
jgi:hypothetical protein